MLYAFCILLTFVIVTMGNKQSQKEERKEVADSVTKSSLDMGNQESQMERMKEVADSVTNFSLDMYQHFTQEKSDSNIFYSPTSVVAALAMTYMGARNNTATQIEAALNLKPGGETLHASFRQYMELIKNEAECTLKLANKLYINEKFEVLKKYIDDVTKYYLTDVSQSDFIKNAERERRAINIWVEKQTADKIKDLIPSGIIGADTVVVIVNAIYFKGDWLSKFRTEDTRKESFHITPSQSVGVDMMYQEGMFNFGRDNGLEMSFLELPYVGKRYSMFVVLPDRPDGLAAIETKLDVGLLAGLSLKTRNQEVQVSLPKFRLEDNFDLYDVMLKLGMSDLFDAIKADLSGMNVTDELFLSKAIHKSFIEVNEEGSEAAAATAHIIAIECEETVERFFADHPFLFFIRDNRADMILFMGRFFEPTVTG